MDNEVIIKLICLAVAETGLCLRAENILKSLTFYKAIGFKCYEKEKKPPAIDRFGFKENTLAINMESKVDVDEFLSLVKKNNGKIVKNLEIVSWEEYSGSSIGGYYMEVVYSDDLKFDEQNMLIIENK